MMMKRYILFVLFICCVGSMCMQSCDTEGTDSYGQERFLYFERLVKRPTETSYEWVRVDTAVISVAHYPNMEQIEHPFRICLVGDMLTADAEYKVTVVDTLTNMGEGMITFPEKLIFKKGVTADSLWLTIHSDKVPEGGEFYVTVRVVENENFGVGYKGYTDVKLWFNNKNSKPDWWDDRVVEVYLGEWSPEKFETLVIATNGITSFEGLFAGEMRRYSLMLKDYIEENGITEKNGDPMIVPVY